MAFNILIVDDSETMRAVIKKTVKISGLQIGKISEAGNGKEALAVLADAWIDAVISDINMPEMGGVELLKEIKQDEVLKNIPVIFVSTESSQKRVDEAEELGVAAYVKKPFMPEKIKSVLLEVLNKAYAGRMAEEGAFTPDAPVEEDEEMDF